MKHVSVLLKEAVDGLNVRDGLTYVDATLGYAGHSSEIHKRLKRGFLFAFDQDIRAIDHSSNVFKDSENVTLIHANFVSMKEKLLEHGVEKVDGIIFDLGLSSPQIDETSRGFSFMRDAELDMRMDESKTLSAKTVVNEYDIQKLIDIFFTYGEERYSKEIAKGIVRNRPINTTLELVEVIKSSVPTKYFLTHHPERRIFQAIRIEVNDELRVLETVLPEAIDILNPGGRICVITFHSLEDRITKQIFSKYSKVDDLVKGLPEIPEEFKPKIKLINKKPILPSE
ncbi:MAG TPA: 16S rRNA (cytosine(1402)-N(4))-methyltransferase, partial [Firmicutes bacterium]|nr:16S rRNA (cytosine(1402)-N(4))-methyltransferase [Bacillota bacterium]